MKAKDHRQELVSRSRRHDGPHEEVRQPPGSLSGEEPQLDAVVPSRTQTEEMAREARTLLQLTGILLNYCLKKKAMILDL